MTSESGLAPVPMKLAPHPVERVWGGCAVEKAYGWKAPEGKTIGEWWTLSFRHDFPSEIADGRFAGIPLPQLTAAHPELLGQGVEPELLIKFLDSADRLSVQVHPDDALAKEMGLDSGKTECWYYLESEPGATIYHGIRKGIEIDAFIDEAAKNPPPEKMLSLIDAKEVKAGELSLIRAGTVHAMGAGVFLMEVQQNSDTTFRIYDWGRPRPLHIEEARKALKNAKPDAMDSCEVTSDAPTLTCDKFVMNRIEVSGTSDKPEANKVPDPGDAYACLSIIHGSGKLVCDGYESGFEGGDTFFLPAKCPSLSIEGKSETVCIFSQQR